MSLEQESTPVRVSAVSYVNSYPFIYGLRQFEAECNIALSLDVPSVCAQKVRSGEVDLGLMPVAELALMPNGYVLSDLCIGAVGPVGSVCLFSQVPLHKIERIVLDPESRTSVQLVRILTRQYWRIQPTWVEGSIHLDQEIKGTTAALIIGDRTFGLSNRFAYTFDLAQEWQEWTGLPFVFAAWVANRVLPEDFLHSFNMALHHGVRHRAEAVFSMTPVGTDPRPRIQYVEHNISYPLDVPKLEAMRLFMRLLQ